MLVNLIMDTSPVAYSLMRTCGQMSLASDSYPVVAFKYLTRSDAELYSMSVPTWAQGPPHNIKLYLAG